MARFCNHFTWALLVLATTGLVSVSVRADDSVPVTSERNDTSRNDLLMTAPAPASCDPHYEVWNATTQQCVCNEGLHGMGCRMCDSTAACLHAMGDRVGFSSCVWGLRYSATSDQKTYQCRVDAGQQVLPVGSELTIQCDRSQQTCVIKSIAATPKSPSLHCALESCTIADGSTDVHCARSTCECEGDCSLYLKAVTMRTPRSVIKAVSDTHVTLNFENAGFFIPVTCTASACEANVLHVHTMDGENDGPDAASASAQKVIRAIVYVVCGVILIAVLWCGCYWKSCWKEFQNWNRTECLTASDTESEGDPNEIQFPWSEAP